MSGSTPRKTSQKIRHLRGGEKVPTSAPRKYRQKSGYIILRWTIGRYAEVEVREHRVVNGFVLPGSIHVHHKNGIRDDNRRENLQFLSQSDHAKIHNQPRFNIGEATQLYGEGWSLPRLAEKYGIHSVSIMRTLKRYGVAMRTMSEAWAYRTNKTRLDVGEVTDLLRKGYRVAFIASLFGVSRWPVEAIRVSAGIPPFPVGAPKKVPDADLSVP